MREECLDNAMQPLMLAIILSLIAIESCLKVVVAVVVGSTVAEYLDWRMVAAEHIHCCC
jgi:hypothetical protein